MISNSEKLDESNYCPNITKKKNIDLDEDEENYKRDHSGFRSKIESEYFAIFVKKFQRFSLYTTKRTINFKSFNLELKIACLLFNINKFVVANPHLFEDYIDFHSYYLNDDWDFNYEGNTIFIYYY
jgi:hypothetical protein